MKSSKVQCILTVPRRNCNCWYYFRSKDQGQGHNAMYHARLWHKMAHNSRPKIYANFKFGKQISNLVIMFQGEGAVLRAKARDHKAFRCTEKWSCTLAGEKRQEINVQRYSTFTWLHETCFHFISMYLRPCLQRLLASTCSWLLYRQIGHMPYVFNLMQ